MPTGTFTNRTDLQPKAAVRTPPASDPAAKPADKAATKTPSARFLARPSGNVAARIARAVADVMAAPMPWNPRAMTSGTKDGDKPATKDATVKRLIPARKSRFWP